LSYWKLINHQREKLIYWLSRMLLEKNPFSKGKSDKFAQLLMFFVASGVTVVLLSGMGPVCLAKWRQVLSRFFYF